MPNEGVKHDTGKQRYDLVAPEGLAGLVSVLTFGATKYADRNWEKGMVWGRLFAATMRHLWAWWRGEQTDPESGLSHLHHAACCIHFLQTYEARNIGTDDRENKKPTASGGLGPNVWKMDKDPRYSPAAILALQESAKLKGPNLTAAAYHNTGYTYDSSAAIAKTIPDATGHSS